MPELNAEAIPKLSSPPSKENAQLIEHLQTEARKVLDALIPSNAHIILLDYPHHPNVGDSMIWLGEIAYLKSRGIKPSYVCDYKNYNASYIRGIYNKNSIILIHGGGNFGSLWKHLHDFKLQVLRDFPQLLIIQLPQSIHFEDDQGIAETAEVIKKHGNFTLLVRSHESLALAQKHFSSNIILCPDLAFFIGAISSKTPPIVDCFVLSRTDAEKSSAACVSNIKCCDVTACQTADWLEMSNKEYLITRIEMHYLVRKFFDFIDPNNRFLLVMWNLLARARLARGVALLSRGNVILTDRLHAHILSILMNKLHVVVDNSYGKLGDFYHAWTSQYPSVLFVKDLTTLQKATTEFVGYINQRKKSDSNTVISHQTEVVN